MRGALRTLAIASTVVMTATSSSACVPDKDKEPEWRQPPKAWNTKGDELTFGEKNLDAFNSMSSSERAAHLEGLGAAPGSFKGQANFQRATELGDKMDDAQYGQYSAYATVADPVLYEITIDYYLFATEDLGSSLPPGTFVEFTGTLADLRYDEEAKPRKLEIKVKDVKLNRLED